MSGEAKVSVVLPRLIAAGLQLFSSFLPSSEVKVRVCFARSADRARPLQWLRTSRERERVGAKERGRGWSGEEEVNLTYLQSQTQIITLLLFAVTSVIVSRTAGWLTCFMCSLLLTQQTAGPLSAYIVKLRGDTQIRLYCLIDQMYGFFFYIQTILFTLDTVMYLYLSGRCLLLITTFLFNTRKSVLPGSLNMIVGK